MLISLVAVLGLMASGLSAYLLGGRLRHAAGGALAFVALCLLVLFCSLSVVETLHQMDLRSRTSLSKPLSR